MTNIDLTQILSLLQATLQATNKIIDSQPVIKPDSGVKASVNPTTASSGNSFHDENEDDDGLLRDITQEIELESKRGASIHVKLQKAITDLIWASLKRIS